MRKLRKPSNRQQFQRRVLGCLLKNNPKGIVDIIESCLSERGDKTKIMKDKRFSVAYDTLYCILKRRNGSFYSISRLLAYIYFRVLED